MTMTDGLASLRSLIARHGTAHGEPLGALAGVRLVATEAPTPLFSHICEPALALVAQGRKRMEVGNRAFECAAGQYLIVPVDLPVGVRAVEASTDRPFLSCSVRLKPDAISALLLDAGTAHRERPEPPRMAVSDLAPDIVEAVVRLLQLLERPADIPVLAGGRERELLWALLNSQQRAMLMQIGRADSHIAQISRAARFIRTRYAEAIRITTLAKIAGMSVTSFHRHFRAVTSLTPIQYQKQIRLQAARARLVSGMHDVGSVGSTVGYDSPSQFSREYRRMFGHPPGKDRAGA